LLRLQHWGEHHEYGDEQWRERLLDGRERERKRKRRPPAVLFLSASDPG
jgi:hypothetical protein